MSKPRRITHYRGEVTAGVRSALLSLATALGDLLDELVVVGGLVPSLLIPDPPADDRLGAHAGTMDLDLGMSIGLLEAERYKQIRARLISLGFRPDVNEQGNPTHQTWVAGDGGATIDFLIPTSDPGDKAGTLRHLERDFAAILTPGLELAFERRVRVPLADRTHRGERAEREVWVADAGPFVMLKALAFTYRGEPKDAYDLYYVVRGFGTGPEEIAEQLADRQDHPQVAQAVAVLRKDFASADHVGPRRVEEFLGAADDPDLRQDVVGFIARLLRATDERSR